MGPSTWRLIPVNKWLITMLSVSSVSRFDSIINWFETNIAP